ncbi:cyclin-like protein [Gaertneriomyces semiglobifer]|nr:cyclin-like protein [Gaertneriomyces semiglobifer]
MPAAKHLSTVPPEGLPQLFEQASQYRHWRFTQEELQNLREKVNREGVERAKQAFKEEWELNPQDGPPPEVECLTWEEQLKYCRFYEGKLVDYCNFFKFDRTVQATALAYFKRFYLLQTVMDYDPKLYLMTCIFLSTKTENSHMSLDNFLSKIPKSPSREKMLELEFTLSTGIRFEYMVHHPFWPLHGFFLDMQTYIQTSYPRTAHDHLFNRLQKSCERAEHFAKQATLSDLVFTHMPSQIALGCFMVAAKESDFVSDLEKYLVSRFHAEPEKLAQLRIKLDEIATELETDRTVDKATASQIAQKLRKCQNPAFDPDSALFKHRTAKEHGDHQGKNAKGEDVQQVVSA